jgi:sulfoxide reductase heme-binding subunit YedZ
LLLGVRTPTALFGRHLLAATVAAVLVFSVWQMHASWSPDMRLWKAFGGASLGMLWFAVFIGPAARLWRPLTRLVPWRREFGIWFVVISVIHAYLVWDGWARWDVAALLGYQLSPETGMYLRAEPGFGLANILGLMALMLGLGLAATSFDRAVGFLGISAWKWLHTLAYAAFFLTTAHVLYFAFMHYTPASPEAQLYAPNPLRWVYLAMMVTVSLAQAAAFVRTTMARRSFGGA